MECSSEEGRQSLGRKSNDCASPEFEFWMVSNPSIPEPNLLTADELFSDGVLLPLHLLSVPSTQPPPPPTSDSPSILSTPSSSPSSSKRWKDIFKVSDKKPDEKKEKKPSSGGGATELNIHIWPFSRSRSAGTAGAGRSKPAPTSARKSSSAPCSRSNSSGRKWAASPGRAAGVPVGRTSPVWQFRRPPGKGTEPKIKSGIRGLNLNVNTCIGYRTQMSCRGDGKHRVTSSDGIKGDVSNSGTLFSLRTLFSKKVY
ncbi:hypothetical protein J5N97_007190 [Dioscorea zingiberensis]|uniref:Uncharacterized protein n=1 Tax=Dioscorea zingiberensis TaxID=325984 RepID=A0A9D5HTZ9_9LILI|nr:hypothetical protein J5N97_007190 [Dioscorea zingiberensis]